MSARGGEPQPGRTPPPPVELARVRSRRRSIAVVLLAVAACFTAGLAYAASAKPPAVPRGVYVISPGVGFQVGAQGRAMGRFLLPVRCGRTSLSVPRVAIAADGRFRFQGRLYRTVVVSVTIAGRFSDRRTAVGEIEVRGRDCPTRPTRFVARLS